MTDPDVLFLDEPTLGLDVSASRDVRALIRNWLEEHKKRTLLLTTHYMVEAEELCDRVAIINQGKVLACDSPVTLKKRLQEDVLFEIKTSRLNGLTPDSLEALPEVHTASLCELEDGALLKLALVEESALGPVINTLSEKNIAILNLKKLEPSLEDVFVELVGHSIAEAEKAEANE